MSATLKERRNSGLRRLKGIGAFVLLLALPTYSYLDHPPGRGEAGSAASPLQEHGPDGGSGAVAPELLSWNGAPRSPRQGFRKETHSSLGLDGRPGGSGGRSVAGVLPAQHRRVPAGVPSAVDTSAGFVRQGSGRTSPYPTRGERRFGGGSDLAIVESETVGRLVDRSSSGSALDNPFLAALQERGSRTDDAQAPTDPAQSMEDPDLPPAVDDSNQVGAEAAEPDDAAPVGDQKERRDDPPPPDDGSQSPPEGSDSNSDSGGNADTGGDTEPDDSSGNGNQDPSQPEQDPQAPPPNPYNFLVVPLPNPADGGLRVFRAKRDETDESLFLLEDGTSDVFPQFQLNQIIGVPEEGTLLTSDVNFDGLLDAVVATNSPGGCILEVYLKNPSSVGGPFLEPVRTTLPKLNVRSMALLDFDFDNALDLAVLFKDRPQLAIFRLDLEERTLKLLEERQMPFEPSLVIDWEIIHTGGWPERLLFVFDETLTQAAATNSFEPGKMQIVSQVPIGRTLLVNWPNRQREAEVLVFESENRIILAEATRSGYLLHGILDTTFVQPRVVVGDYLGNGTRQLIVFP